MPWSLKETTPATKPPVTIADAKAHLVVTSSTDDALISSYVHAAGQMVSNLTGRSLINSTYTLLLPNWPSTYDQPFLSSANTAKPTRLATTIRLPRSPLVSVSSIKYYDSDNTQQTISSSNYIVTTGVEPPTIEPLATYSWPPLYSRDWPIEIIFVAGYGTAETSIPDAIQHAIKMLVANWYENRESVLVGTISKPIEHAVDALLSDYRLMDFT